MLNIKLFATAVAVAISASAALAAPPYDPPAGPYLSYEGPGYYGYDGWAGRPLPGSREAFVEAN
jgi:hypothetical protein